MLMRAGDFGRENGNDSQNIYATDLYQPISFPIPVEYFDYGYCRPREGYEDCWQKETSLPTIQDLMVDSPDEFGIEEATDREVLTEMEVPLVSKSCKGLVTFNLIREDVYQVLIQGSEEDSLQDVSYKEMYMEKVKKKGLSEEYEDWESMSGETKRMFERFDDRFLGSYLNRVNCYFLHHVLLHPNGEFERSGGFNEIFGEFMQLIINMENLRKGFRSQVGGGSQSLTGEIHEKFYGKVLEISQETDNYL